MRRLLLTALVALLGLPAGQALGGATPTAVTLGTGVNPWVLVDRQGTTHVVWDERSPNSSTLRYSRRPAGAAAFSPARTLPVVTGHAGPDLNFAGPRIVQDPAPGDRLLIVVQMCCERPGTYVLASADNGVTWDRAAPVYNGSPAVNPSDGPVQLVASRRLDTTRTELLVINGNPGPVRVVRIPGDLGTVVDQSDPAREIAVGSNEAAYDGSVALDENNQPVFATATLSALFLRVGEGGTDIPVATSGLVPTIKIAGGPRGVVAVTMTGTSRAGRGLEARRLTGGALGAPVRLNAAGDDGPRLPFITTDPTGRYHVVWKDDAGAVVYRRSENGVAWNATRTVVSPSLSTAGLVAAAGPDGKGWLVFTTSSGNGPIRVVRLDATTPAPSDNPAVPDLTGIPNPTVTRNGPTTIIAPRRVSVAAYRRLRTKCINVRVQSTRPARVRVAIFSGRRSIRLFGTRTVVFTRPGKRVVCIRVPLRAVTANVRQPFGFVTAYKVGTRPRPGEGPGVQRQRRIVLFP